MAALSLTAPAEAWQHSGCRWNRTQIRFTVPAPIASYPTWTNAVSLWGGLHAKFVINASGTDLTGMNENRGNTVSWSGVLRKSGTTSTAPECFNGDYRPGQVQAVLNWSGMSNSGYSSNRKRMVAAHELGHAFGLGHTPNHREWLMYPTDAGRTVLVPQTNDKEGVNAIY